MAALIKNQILKHLSKFVLNLSPSQINLSTLKGEGELTGLELNCAVLTQLLELPVWVRLVSASCNRAAIRIQWTKLKTVPIQLQLDEIRVTIETCDELREGQTVNGPSLPQQGYYGFTEKIVDGISVSINLVHVNLTSLAFTASFQMSRILVESKSPSWGKSSLPHTRLKDLDKGEVLVFKELSWQTVRIEARSTVAIELTPLRLITNQARCRITLKKRMSDCAILGVRLVTILDDLLWVLTDDQLKAALHFVDSVSGLVKKATESTQKVKAARKLDNSGVTTKKASQSSNNPAGRMFAKYDVVETSYHFYTDRIDLHFCDDPGGGRSEHPELNGGGAFQISLARLQLDYYPYHLARGDRKHWVRYSNDANHKSWLLSNLASFDTKLLDVVLSGQNKTPLSRAGAKPGGKESGQNGKDAGCDEGMRDLVVSQLSRMMTTNVILRLGDLTLWRVSTSSSPSGRNSQPLEMLKGDCARLHLPPDLPLIHCELTQFYYPGDLDFPLPPPCLLLSVNPITIWFDLLTLVWFNSFAMNLQKSVSSLQESLQIEEGDAGYADVKVELVMPRIIAAPKAKQSPHKWKPNSLLISASKISISNYRSLETGCRADLANSLDKFQQSPMFFGGSFPCKPTDPGIIDEKFWTHATGADDVREAPTMNMAPGALFKKDLLWTDSRDVWYCGVASVWAEFEIAHMRPVPLIDATPLQLWIYAKPDQKPPAAEKETRPNRKLLSDFYGETKKENVGMHMLAVSNQLISVQLDHHQLLFLLRLVDSLSEMGAFLSSDSCRILSPVVPAGMIIAAVIPQIDINIILPATVTESESIKDRESPHNQIEIDTGADAQDLVVDMEQKLDELQPVVDHSDPLSMIAEESAPSTTPIISTPNPPSSRMPEPPVKLQLQPALSNGIFSNSKSAPNSSSKSKNITSSFNSKMDGLSSVSWMSLSGAKSPELDLDSLSVRSDDSGDSSWHESEAGWTMVSDNMDIGEGLFRVNRDASERGPSPAEMAEEVYETLSDGAQRSGSRAGLDSHYTDDTRMVSILTLHLGKLSLAQISGDKSSSLLLDAASLATSVSDPQDYQQFQFRFGQSCKSWSESTLSAPDESVIKIRIESDNLENPAKALAELPDDLDIPLAERISRISQGSIQIEVNGAQLSFMSSTLTKLSEWAMDEIIPTPQPMTININSVIFTLADDAPTPPGYPQPPPIEFNIPSTTLSRDTLGKFTLQSASSGDASTNSKPVKAENSMRTELDLALAEVRILRAKLSEKDNQINELEAKNTELSKSSSQRKLQIDNLEEDKRSLMDTLKYLQEELIKSGKK